MLSFANSSFVQGRPVRREFLRVGSLATSAIALNGLGALSTFANTHRSLMKDKSVVLVFMQGGPSQYETFDPKMEAPSSIRCATGEVATSIPGITFGDTFSKLAKRAHLFNIVRSFVTGDGNHDIKPVMSKDTLRANMGSLYSRVVGPMHAESAMPTNVALFPRAVNPDAGPPLLNFGNFESSGDLGAAYAPFVPGAGAGLQQDLRMTLPQTRLEDRRSLLAGLDTWKRLAEVDANIEGTQALQGLAFDALLSGVADAFDFSKEPKHWIDAYDTLPLANPDRIDKKWNNHKHYADHGSSIGKLMLLARRLCERGCGFITVTTSFVWDMHADINNAPMREGMGYVGLPFDHAISTFIDDIEARGMRDKVLLVCCGEMGRTPKINAGGGRDHWGNLAPLLVYGGGLNAGQVIGKSSRDGGEPQSDPVRIPDLIATIMHRLLDMDQVRITDGLPRNLLELFARGTPIRGL